MWGKWATAAKIDSAVAERDVEYLAHIIGDEDVPADVRQHLAKVIRDILTGAIAFPRKRPKKKGLNWEKERLAEQVWNIKKSKGWKKISSAVEYVAKEKGCSPRTVWKCWAGFNPVRYEIKREEALYDAMYSDAMEASREAAMEYLTETEGAREFSNEEIADAEHELHANALEAFADEIKSQFNCSR